MKKIIKYFFLFTSVILYSQVNFETGYFIKNDGTKTNCFIKNYDSRYNPNQIVFKGNLDEKERIANINDIKEFGIGDKIKFERFDIQIDKEERDTYGISDSKDFEFINKTVFLKTLVEGKANLYFYEDTYSYRYFISTELNEVSQLIYKKYRPIDGSTVSNNESYKTQLFNTLKCEGLTSKDFRKLNYYRKELVDILNKYNECSGGNSKKYDNNKKKGAWNFKIKVGVNFADSDVDFSPKAQFLDLKTTDFDSNTSLKFGVELEYIFPFNKNKWSAYIEPTYGSFEGESNIIQRIFADVFEDNVSINYSFIEVPIGLRHYFYLNGQNKSRIFINAGYVFTFDIGDKLIDYENGSDVEINSRANLVFGLGYSFDKYSLELRTATPRNISSERITVKTTYNQYLSLIFSG